MHPVNQFLEKLIRLQSVGDAVFPKGIFPSYRYHPWLPYQRPDDNIFCTAVVAYTLQKYWLDFDATGQALAKQIIDAAKASYPLFANKDGKNTYNFWQTRPSRHFPNGHFMHRFEHFRIPDDADDTAYVALTSNYTQAEATALRNRLIAHAANVKRPIFNTWPQFRHLRAYSTFFGEKMYIEFDACVLTNVLLFVHKHFTDLNEHERDAYTYLIDVVISGKHRTQPFQTAGNYPTTLLIVYHMARLLQSVPACPLAEVKSILMADAQHLFESTTGIEKIVAHTALQFLGADVQPITPSEEILSNSRFFFFHAGMLTAFENPFVKQYLAPRSVVHLRYESEALNLVLRIENTVLSLRKMEYCNCEK